MAARGFYTDWTVTWDAFLDDVHAWLTARKLAAPDQCWVVGVSGGPDSTLLLHTLVELSRRARLGWHIHAAHLHHGLRGEEADADAHYASDQADALGVSFHQERADIRAAVERDGGSTEEVARQHRYDFLERAALRCGSDLVAVAHHADDNAETVLHRICRGTALRGLIGIHDMRAIRPDSYIRLVRPLLGQRRETIVAMCAERKIEIRSDSTNNSMEFTRGRIRHKVMPLLRDLLNPQVSDALLRLSEHARWLGSYLEDAASRTFESLVIDEGARHVVLNTRALLSKQHLIQAEVVRRAILVLLHGEQDLSFAHVEGILRLAEDPTSGKEVHVPGRIVVRKQYDRLEFRFLEDESTQVEIETAFVTCPGRTLLPALGMELSAELREVRPEDFQSVMQNNNRHEEWLDWDRVVPPLLVRGRRDGDRFRPLGGPGAKTIGDFFTEQKVDPQVRARTGILCDQRGPLWVMPLRIDERAKLRPASRHAVRLILRPLTQPGEGA